MYALTLSDLARTTLGDDAANLAGGDLRLSPLSPVRLLLSLLAHQPLSSPLSPANSELVSSLATRLLSLLPAPSGLTGSAVSSAGVDELTELLSGLEEGEREAAWEAVNHVTQEVTTRLLERAQSLD